MPTYTCTTASCNIHSCYAHVTMHQMHHDCTCMHILYMLLEILTHKMIVIATNYGLREAI